MTLHVAVVGGGHNGLVAANYLARFGAKVTVLEARSQLGGPAGRREYMPGYFGSITNSPGSLEGRVIQELELERYGLRFVKPDVTLLQPLRDGLFVGWRDRGRVAAQLNEFCPGEASRHSALIERLDALGAASGLSLWEQPQSVTETLEAMPAEVRDEFSSVILGGSLMELLDDALKSDAAKSMMMMVALNSQMVSPYSPGSGMGLMMRPISRASSSEDVLGIRDAPLRGSVGLPAGSMGSIVDALTLAAHSHGVHVRTNARVSELDLGDDGRVSNVVLESGERIEGIDAVVATVEPSRLADMLPRGVLPDGISPKQPEGSAFKIVLALESLPEVAYAPDDVPVETLMAAQFRIAPDPAYITASINDGLAGSPSSAPIMWGLVPSVTSPGLAPHGKHIMSINAHHAPSRLGRDFWREHSGDFVTRCLENLELAFPGLEDRIAGIKCLTPFDIEDEYGLTGSNITQGDMLPPGFLDGRPGRAFSEHLRKMAITLGGAGGWPGGYVTGAPGRNAARSVINSRRSARSE